MYQIDFKKPMHIYFIGIGGISMSGLAEILLNERFRISGSDRASTPLTTSLSEKGAEIFYGQRASNLKDNIELVIYTAAIHPDNPEYRAALEQGIPMLSRAELLGQLMCNYKTPIAVSGTHGKTTTTAMISEILLQADTDPTLSIGGIFPSIGGNIRVGNSDYFLTEACEYTDSFLHFFPRISIILNIEEDHLDYFKDIHDIRNSFHKFAQILPKDGLLILNGETECCGEIVKDIFCPVITYGLTPDFDYYATDISYDEMARPRFTLHRKGADSVSVRLGVTGLHNVSNALAAFALADFLGISSDITKASLLSFHGTERRFEYKGSIGGITIIDDYAHHPTEITATLSAAANFPHKKLWCIFQPHTYTRTKAFLTDFAKALSCADRVVLADIYAARETDNLGMNSSMLRDLIRENGTECEYFSSFDEIENYLLENCMNGDMLITMGAGDINKIGEKLLGC